MHESRLRVQLFPRAETAVKRGHPWVYGDSIKSQNREGEVGDLAVMYDRQDRFLAIGLYDPKSPIRVRIVHRGKPVPINRDWWQARAEECLRVRESQVLSERTTGARMIHGESDGFPGFVADRYADTLVVKIYTAVWLPRWQEMESVIREVFAPRFLVLRMSRNIQDEAKIRWGLEEGFRGDVGNDTVVFAENGVWFEAAVRDGQKTGFFLDQRENRARVELLAAGRDVLNVFSFSGAFSLYAARGGAKSVTDLDISAHALESAMRNYELNENDQRIRRVKRQSVQADAFKWLDETHHLYDLVIVDPPSLAKREKEREGALRAYHKLNASAIQRLRPRGILVAASCSAHVTSDEFFAVIDSLASRSGRRYRELWTSGHAADHPVNFSEAHYLKARAIQLD